MTVRRLLPQGSLQVALPMTMGVTPRWAGKRRRRRAWVVMWERYALDCLG
ncbi:MAG: hypothetical protein AAFW76_11875 [Pseudomonadota bacterium]